MCTITCCDTCEYQYHITNKDIKHTKDRAFGKNYTYMWHILFIQRYSLQVSLLLTWFNLNPGMNKKLHPL